MFGKMMIDKLLHISSTLNIFASSYQISYIYILSMREFWNLQSWWWCLKKTRLIFEHTYILKWNDSCQFSLDPLELSLLLHCKMSIWRWWPLLIKTHDSSNQPRLAIYTSHWIHGVGKVMNLSKPWCLKYYYLASFLIDVYLE